MCDLVIVGWGEFGLVIQVYFKCCLLVLVWLILFGCEFGVCILLCLVKGVYWDSEIKQCQVQGVDGYFVYICKEGIDIFYLVCVCYLFSEYICGVIYLQFVSYNVYIVIVIFVLVDEVRVVGGEECDFEFQCLYGMGDVLYDMVIEKYCCNVCIYVLVGVYKDLLLYLVCCLLENGVNFFFVYKLVDLCVLVEMLIQYLVI